MCVTYELLHLPLCAHGPWHTCEGQRIADLLSLFPPLYGSWGSNSAYQACIVRYQLPSPHEPYCWPDLDPPVLNCSFRITGTCHHDTLLIGHANILPALSTFSHISELKLFLLRFLKCKINYS